MVADRTQEARTIPALIGVLVLVVLVVCGIAGGSTLPVSDRRVLVVGDSLTEISKNEVRASLAAAGWRAVVDGRGGLSIGLWRPFVGADTRFTSPHVAVVELGTNDCDQTCRPLSPDIDAIVTKLLDEGVHAILWMNVQEDSPYPRHPRFVNQELERAAVRWPQLSIVDLSSAFAGHPEWHTEDGIHFNEPGRLIYAQLILQALDAFPDAR
jgi:hypothetical protein